MLDHELKALGDEAVRAAVRRHTALVTVDLAQAHVQGHPAGRPGLGALNRAVEGFTSDI